jgi:hypothetical protein
MELFAMQLMRTWDFDVSRDWGVEFQRLALTTFLSATFLDEIMNLPTFIRSCLNDWTAFNVQYTY